MPGKHECWCGRSDSGICVGLHKFSEEDYQKYLRKRPFLLRSIQILNLEIN